MGSLRARTAIAAAFGGVLITIPVALVAITSANTSLMGIVAALLIGGTLGASAGWVAGERSASEIDALRVLVDQANAGDLSASAGLASMREVSIWPDRSTS